MKWGELVEKKHNFNLSRTVEATAYWRKTSERTPKGEKVKTVASHITAESITPITIKPTRVQWRRKCAVGDTELASRSRKKEIIATLKEKWTENFPGFEPVFRIILRPSITPVTRVDRSCMLDMIKKEPGSVLYRKRANGVKILPRGARPRQKTNQHWRRSPAVWTRQTFPPMQFPSYTKKPTGHHTTQMDIWIDCSGGDRRGDDAITHMSES